MHCDKQTSKLKVRTRFVLYESLNRCRDCVELNAKEILEIFADEEKNLKLF